MGSGRIEGAVGVAREVVALGIAGSVMGRAAHPSVAQKFAGFGGAPRAPARTSTLDQPPSTSFAILDADGAVLVESAAIERAMRIGRTMPNAVTVVTAAAGVVMCTITRGTATARYQQLAERAARLYRAARSISAPTARTSADTRNRAARSSVARELRASRIGRRQPGAGGARSREADAFVMRVLAAGSAPAKKIYDLAEREGLGHDAVRDAAVRVGVVRKRVGGPLTAGAHVQWTLPASTSKGADSTENAA